MHRMLGKIARTASALALTATLGSGVAHAQATDQDKAFLKDTAQDTNFEIKTGQLALQKSKSADVKQYATMLIRDHTQLKTQIRAADTAAKAKPEDAGSMSVSDNARYLELKVLSGDTFDKEYIKGLVKGNADAVQKTKDEAANSTVPAVKKLAQRRVDLDTKHTEKARALAQAHKIDVQS